MEEGSLRADVNVSVRKLGKELGTRCEIKNVNSIKFIGQAIEYEAKRQIDIIEESKDVLQETRLFDSKRGETRSMRSKEEAHDYRYFPDPDLLPLIFSENVVEKIKNSLPELPDERKKRFESDYSLSSYDSSVLVGDKETADYFEELTVGRNAKLVSNWLTGEFFAAMNKFGFTIEKSPISNTNFGTLIDLIENNTISNRIANRTFFNCKSKFIHSCKKFAS
jgi:aspartyl-tRNA(Asn)/glutamyl-tRNA(Gln) amidotransferase subunit B